MEENGGAVARAEGSTTPDGAGPETTFDLAIVGGGFSGLCCAYHVLTHEGLPRSFRCTIIEPDERLGAGIAYCTESPRHLLNVRARGMSITEHDSGSFVRWLREQNLGFSPDDFVPRGLYRRYTTACLEQAVRHRPNLLSVMHDRVLAVEPKQDSPCYRLRLGSGTSVRAKFIVLAVGNIPPRGSLDNGILHCPWTPFEDFTGLRSMAVVGAGLTALDVILEAEACGFSGHCWVISPHGQFPRAHRQQFTPLPLELRQWAAHLAAGQPGLRHLVRAFQLKRRSGVDWQQLVDSLRSHAPHLWSALTPRDKQLFLRRFRALWNTHLHRSCVASMDVIARLRDCGRLEQLSARVTAVQRLGSAVRLLLSPETAGMLDVDVAFNATGLFSDVLRTDSPLVNQLIRDGMVRPDDLRLGLMINTAGQLVSADGTLRPDMFAIGTLRRGMELECTAVPEIRKQVSFLVRELTAMTSP